MTEREEKEIRKLFQNAEEEYTHLIQTEPVKSTYYFLEDFLIEEIHQYGVEKSLEGKRESDSI